MNLAMQIDHAVGDFRIAMDLRLTGRVWGLFGPSGSGKTTLLNILAGLARPRRGRVVLNERTLVDTDRRIHLPAQTRRVGCVFQEDRLFPHLDVTGNLRYGMKRRAKQAVPVEFDTVVELLELVDLLDRRIDQLSGGQRRRVAIGRALLAGPELLLLDEPLTGLDGPRRRAILRGLSALAARCYVSMLIVSHQLDEILALTDRLVVIQDGSAVAAGTVEELLGVPAARSLLAEPGLRNVWTMQVGGSRPESCLLTLKSPAAPAESRPLTMHGPAWPELSPGATLRVALRPCDVAVSARPVEGISVQNQLRGRVRRVLRDAGGVLCEVDVGTTILAEVTDDACRQMKLEPGRIVWCLFKARALELLTLSPRPRPNCEPFAAGANARPQSVLLLDSAEPGR